MIHPCITPNTGLNIYVLLGIVKMLRAKTNNTIIYYLHINKINVKSIQLSKHSWY